MAAAQHCIQGRHPIGLYIAVPVALLLALAQTTVLGNATVLGVHLNLLLLFAISWVLRRGLSEGLMIGLLGGMILDVSSAAPFGTWIASLAVAISLAALGEVNVFQGAWFLKFGVVAGAVLLVNLVSVTILRIAGYDPILLRSLGRVIVPELFLHILLMPVMYGLVKWIVNRIEPPAVEF